MTSTIRTSSFAGCRSRPRTPTIHGSPTAQGTASSRLEARIACFVRTDEWTGRHPSEGIGSSSATAVWGISDETGTSRPGRRSDRRGTLEACFAVSAIRGGEMDDAVDAGYQRELRGYGG